jgi:hypothetical protein
VFGPSGANFVSASTTLQVPFASVTKVKIESMARVVRKTWKKKKDDESNKRVIIRQKPHKIKVKLRGDIDGGCDGNNVWDETIRTLIP